LVGLWLAHRHRQQRRDVVHHRLYPGANRQKARQSQQVECSCAQRGHRADAICPVAVGVLVELGVTDPMPALNAPAVPHQLQQGFWGGAKAAKKQVGGLKRSTASGAGSAHLHDPAGANPALANVLRCLLGPQRPGDVAPMADFVIRCHKRDRAFSLTLAGKLAVQGALVGFHGQEEVGPLLLDELKNGRWVCSASAWITTPSRSSSPRSCLRTARSWFSPVA